MTVKLRIILPAALLFLVVLAMFGATWLASSAQKDDALVVNLAGRQRMLSQKMAKETLLAASFSEQEAIAGKIAASMAVFERTLAALSRSGQAPLTLDPAGPQRALPAPSAQAAAQLAKVQAQWGDYKARLEAWRGGKREDAAALLAASEAVNKEMDAAVGLMQRESEGRVGVLLWTQAGLALAALLLTLGIVWSTRRTVIDPLQRLIGFAERVGAGDLATCFEGRCDAELDQLRRSLEQMLADLKTKFGFAEGVLGAISDTFPYLVLDKDGRLTHVNRMMLDLLEMGGKPEEYVGQTPGAFFYDEPGRDTRSARAARERTAVRNEMQYRTRKGTDKSILVSANPIQDFDGKPLGLFSFYYDLTQMRRQEEQLGRQRESLAALASQAENLAGMVGQATQALSRNIQSATRDAHGQEEQVEATARSTQDLDRTVQEVARRAQTAADAASGAIRQAGVGEGSVRDVIHSIQDVDAVAGELKRHMQELGGRAGQIGSIITVIQDIADQTNLLALNAAIEAARAGDAGRGFAVVADEVRKLAEKTMTATRDVTEAVSAIQAGIATNTTATDKAGRAIADSNALAARSGDALRDIVQSVQAMAEQLAAIATLARDQAALSSGISRDLQHVQEVSGNTLRGMEESEQAIAGLTARAEELEHIIEALRSEQAKGAQNTAQPALRASL